MHNTLPNELSPTKISSPLSSLTIKGPPESPLQMEPEMKLT